jgi:hypothetical protein
MSTFKVKYREVIEYELYLEAEDEEKIQENFFELANKENFDFSNGDVVSGYVTYIEEV